MRLLKVLGAVGMAILLALGLAYLNRATIIAMIAHSRLPKVEPNRPVDWAQGPASVPAAGRQPNIVFILTDDLGFNDITFNGGGIANGTVPTPNIDSIGREGVSFTNGYAGNATCAPSRAAIMTGRYPTRFGFEFTPAPVAFQRMVGTETEPGAIAKPSFFRDRIKDMPPGTTSPTPGAMNLLSVPAGEITIAEVLKARGYHTLHLGKWHLGGAPGLSPGGPRFRRKSGLHRRRSHVLAGKR